MDIERVKRGFKLMEEGMQILGGGPLDFYTRKLVECYDLLIDRYSPHKVGDRVVLCRTPEISPKKSHGWMGSKHFLVKGAAAVVREVSADARGFSYELEFEGESWIDRDGKESPIPAKDRHVFHFGEEWIVGVPKPMPSE